MGTKYNTVKKKTYLNNFNFGNINYPLKNKYYEIFETNNETVALNTFRCT